MDQARLLETLEIFSARICHDLVGPVGAIANGVELLSEGGGAADPEVVDLIAGSARSASRRLQFFRTAFGAGNTVSGAQPLDGARGLATAYFADGKLRLNWPPTSAAVDARCDRRAARLVLNLLLVAADCLPRGGVLDVSAATDPAGGVAIVVTAEGIQARLPDDQGDVLGASRPIDSPPPTPRAMPAWLCRSLVAQAAGTLSVDARPAAVVLSLRLPAGG